MFIYRPKQEIEGLDEPDRAIPTPPFASELQLTIADLFAWLSE